MCKAENSILSPLFIIVLMMLCPTLYIVQAQDASGIIKKMDERMRGNTLQAEVTMTIIRPDWQRSVTMKSWSKDNDYSLILITAPARDKGTAFLKRKNEIWNWIPSVDRSIKMPPSMMMQSWMGSDFTNDDLVRESSVVVDYTHELKGDEVIDNKACYKIRLTPKPDAAVVWSHIYVWVTKENYMQLRTEFYDEDNFLINTMVGKNIKLFDGREIPSQMEMIPNDKPGHKTVIEYNSMAFDTPMADNFFSIKNMRRVQ